MAKRLCGSFYFIFPCPWLAWLLLACLTNQPPMRWIMNSSDLHSACEEWALRSGHQQRVMNCTYQWSSRLPQGYFHRGMGCRKSRWQRFTEENMLVDCKIIQSRWSSKFSTPLTFIKHTAMCLEPSSCLTHTRRSSRGIHLHLHCS